MSAIKKGDLVMVVKPSYCCNNYKSVGMVFIVVGKDMCVRTQCAGCGIVKLVTDHLALNDGELCEASRLKKIDPPAEGEYDRVPVRETVPVRVI